MGRIRPRKLAQLNQVLVKKRKDYIRGILDAANLIDDMYSSSSTHHYLLGDCLLLKLNLLRKGQVRKNHRRIRIAKETP